MSKGGKMQKDGGFFWPVLIASFFVVETFVVCFEEKDDANGEGKKEVLSAKFGRKEDMLKTLDDFIRKWGILAEDLSKMQSNSDGDLRLAAAIGLVKMAHASDEVLCMLVLNINTKDLIIRNMVIDALRLDREDESRSIAIRLLNIIKKGNLQKKESAANAMVNLGKMHKEMIDSSLTLLIDHQDPYTRYWSAIALSFVSRKTNVIPILMDAISKADDYGTKKASLESLGHIGREAGITASKIIELFHADELLLLHALCALKQMGEGAVPALRNALNHKSSAIRRFACIALSFVGPAMAKEVVPSLIDFLKTEDEAFLNTFGSAVKTKTALCKLLGEIGRDAALAIPILQINAESDETELRRAALSALISIEYPVAAQGTVNADSPVKSAENEENHEMQKEKK
jgi:HEAT repeat protein